MMSKAQQEEERLRDYLENREEYDQSIIIASGMLLSIFEHIEKANKIAPKVFTNQLKYTIEDSISAIYPKGTEAKIGEAHNEVALYFDKCIENFINSKNNNQ